MKPSSATAADGATPPIPKTSQAPTRPSAIDPQAVAEVQASVPTDTQLAVVVATFEALADLTRAKILYALIRRSLCVRDLALIAGVSESAVSHHLRLLRDRHLVTAQRRGTVMQYRVADGHLAALVREAEYHTDHVDQGLPDHPYP